MEGSQGCGVALHSQLDLPPQVSLADWGKAMPKVTGLGPFPWSQGLLHPG